MNDKHPKPLEVKLITLVTESSVTMSALRAVRELRLPSWCIGAGAIRNLVWDHLHRFERATEPDDVDLIFYEPGNLSQDFEQSLGLALSSKMPSLKWDIVNQARVHHWLQSAHGRSAEPLQSLREGVASWPEVATCVGVTLTESEQIEVLAPHGLQDLFEMIIRWNPERVSREVFMNRVAQKRFVERWPRVRVVPC